MSIPRSESVASIRSPKSKPGQIDSNAQWSNTVQTSADIRHMTCFRTRISAFYPSTSNQSFTKHPTFCVTPIWVFCIRLPSPKFIRAPPCWIYRLKSMQSFRYNKIMPVCQFYCWMYDSQYFGCVWHVFCEGFVHYFAFEALNVTTPSFAPPACQTYWYRQIPTKRYTRVHAYRPHKSIPDRCFHDDKPRNSVSAPDFIQLMLINSVVVTCENVLIQSPWIDITWAHHSIQSYYKHI